jgi:hypothetical protein
MESGNFEDQDRNETLCDNVDRRALSSNKFSHEQDRHVGCCSFCRTEYGSPVRNEPKRSKSVALRLKKCLQSAGSPALCLSNELQTSVFSGSKTGDHKTTIKHARFGLIAGSCCNCLCIHSQRDLAVVGKAIPVTGREGP